MRASRLLSILMTLQVRGRVTAQTLAREHEVSLRTIYRDIDALSASGVPVYSDRGSAGGYRLLEGYRTRLNGFSAEEAQALFLSGLSGPAAALGLGTVMAAAQLKLAVALPAELRSAAETVRTRFHLDAPAWFQSAERPAHLPQIAGAVWRQRLTEIRYRSWKGERRRRIAPLGIVLKGGAWYLVGAADGQPRTYRIGRILELDVLTDTFERPADFDLAAYWSQATSRLESEMHPARAVLRLSPSGFAMLEPLTSAFARAGARVEDADADGYRVAVLPVGSLRQACCELLRFGTEAEVLGPPELRAEMRRVVDRMGQQYRVERASL